MPQPFQLFQNQDSVFFAYQYAGAVREVYMEDPGEAPIDSWMGWSAGSWDGDTLVVTTKNFKEISGLGGADENLMVEERFSTTEDGNLLYDFTVQDETVWTAPWSGEYVWTKSQSKVYEYACHEGNYSMGNILRGARLLEAEWRAGEAVASSAGE